MSDRITITDIRKAGFCVSGTKDWFLTNGWTKDEFRAFLKAGIPRDEFINRGDHLAQVVVDRKREREGQD